MEYYSFVKNENMAFLGKWMGLEIITLTEVTHCLSRQMSHFFSCMDVSFGSLDGCLFWNSKKLETFKGLCGRGIFQGKGHRTQRYKVGKQWKTKD